jgi:ribonuclease HI
MSPTERRPRSPTSVTFYTDGACKGNHRLGRGGRMGAGIIGIADGYRREWSIPLGPGTNQMAELLAVKTALLKVKDRPNTRVTIITDSQYAIGCLTGGWKVVGNYDLVQEIFPLIRECASFGMEKVLGHAGQADNERADRLAVAATKEGAVATCENVATDAEQPTADGQGDPESAEEANTEDGGDRGRKRGRATRQEQAINGDHD